MIATSMTLAAAAMCCSIVYEVSKWYFENYCQDNPEIFWIWLDEDEPQRGHPVKNDRMIETGFSQLTMVPTM